MDCIIVWRNGRGSPFSWYMALPDVRHYRRYQDVSIHISGMGGARSNRRQRFPRINYTTVQRTHIQLRLLVNTDLQNTLHIYKSLFYHCKAAKWISLTRNLLF